MAGRTEDPSSLERIYDSWLGRQGYFRLPSIGGMHGTHTSRTAAASLTSTTCSSATGSRSASRIRGTFPGYVTEKIFDCLTCGTVPIYLGAPNIADYVPRDCFVDMRDLGSFDVLASLLRQMGPTEVGALRDAGAEYLRSPSFAEWRPEKVFRSIVENLA